MNINGKEKIENSHETDKEKSEKEFKLDEKTEINTLNLKEDEEKIDPEYNQQQHEQHKLYLNPLVKQASRLSNHNTNNVKPVKEEEKTKSFERNCNIYLSLITSVIPNTDEVDETEEKCICVPIDTQKEKCFIEEEIIPEVLLIATVDNKIQLSTLITILKQYGFPLTSSLIYYYHRDAEEFISCGSDPLDLSIYIPLGEPNDSSNTYSINLKCYCYLDEEFINTIETQVGGRKPKAVDNESKDNSINLKSSNARRTKERKIGFIIEKVNAWRKLYNGFYDENNDFVKYTLEDAAEIIGISKKSLDDYLLQLRLGRKFGFDFNLNKHKKVGELRTFVRQEREKSNLTNISSVKEEDY